jgi:hypothetical protein
MKAPNIRHRQGWVGAFTRETAPGAIKSGTRVVKQNSEPGDGHPDGTPGVVLGSMPVDEPSKPNIRILYFVEWAPKPRCAVATADFKVVPLQ